MVNAASGLPRSTSFTPETEYQKNLHSPAQVTGLPRIKADVGDGVKLLSLWVSAIMGTSDHLLLEVTFKSGLCLKLSWKTKHCETLDAVLNNHLFFFLQVTVRVSMSFTPQQVSCTAATPRLLSWKKLCVLINANLTLISIKGTGECCSTVYIPRGLPHSRSPRRYLCDSPQPRTW